MTGAEKPGRDRLGRTTLIAIAGLGVTQVIGWGSTYYLLTVLGGPMSRSLDLSPAMVSSGLSIMLVLGAVLGPVAGRAMDMNGARFIMALGSALAAVGLAALSFAVGPVSYIVAWLLIGLSSPLILYPAAFTALTQVDPGHARQAITFLTLPGGLASTVFWPLSEWLLTILDWRAICQVYAVLNLVVCLPLHLAVIRRAEEAAPAAQASSSSEGLPGEARRLAFLLFAGALALNALLVTGILNQFIDLMRRLGQTPQNAVLIGMIFGMSQTSARVLELSSGARMDMLRLGLGVTLGFPAAVILLMIGPSSLAAGIAFAVVFGACNGLWTIVRGALVLRLFGVKGYGENLGTVIVAQGLAAAAAPVVLAGILDWLGVTAAMTFAVTVSLLALVAMALLFRHATRHEQPQHPA